MNILVVDDEKDIVDLIAWNLEREGFTVSRAYDGEEALKSIQSARPGLVLLDLMLPGMTGFEVCRLVRKNPETASLPVIMLTAKTDEIDKVLGLEIGADDYITKPFSVRELIARVRAVLRRARMMKPDDALDNAAEAFNFRGLQVNYQTYEISRNGLQLDLSPTEIKLLIFFTRNPGRVFTRDQILDHVWGDHSFVEPRTVDVHIRRLRQQMEKDSENPEFIMTVRGIGYKFNDKS
jgi:phosphate regulon transcriptional regulator PhoB